ncbi:MAG: hypothetical protein JXR80_09010 [Deltaproteobacteria bacterium]|nr:hypothetical protein [Deltaproteobacteria bacterium]
MKILSHRGFWLKPEEKNCEAAFIRSFQAGFGLETDLRDHNGDLVISHDPPRGVCMRFDEFAQIYKEHAFEACLALNIKADGLQSLLKSALKRYAIDNYFVFDMSAPDTLVCLDAALKVFTRQSEIEPEPICYDQACGVWIDCFYREWITLGEIRKSLDKGKEICLVSPELHRRPHEQFWDFLKKNGLHLDSNIMICTDFPQTAKDFFDD